MLRSRSISMMGGIVASPTPTVPMSGDSMTVMMQPVPGSDRAKMLAAIQPAVPPPTIAMRLIRLLSVTLPGTLDSARRAPPLHGGGGGGARALELALHADEESAAPNT